MAKATCRNDMLRSALKGLEPAALKNDFHYREITNNYLNWAFYSAMWHLRHRLVITSLLSV